jgi:hypothetical protein
MADHSSAEGWSFPPPPPKRKALQPRQRYFGLFFETVEQQQKILYFACSKRFKWECAGREASVCSNCAVSWSCGRTVLGNRQTRQLVIMECLEAQCQEHFEWIWNFSHTKISALHKLTVKNIERWPQHAAWAEGIRARSIFVWTGLLINRICGFGGRNFQRTFTKKQSRKESRPLGCHV